jgi:hypothetical protein
MMGPFSFWVASLLFPMFLLAVNSIARWWFGMHQSAAGDLIVLFGAFDGAVILEADDFRAFSRVLSDANDLRAWFLLVLLINIMLWAVAVFGVERGMISRHMAGVRRFSRWPALSIIGYLGISGFATFLNTAAFTLRVQAP